MKKNKTLLLVVGVGILGLAIGYLAALASPGNLGGENEAGALKPFMEDQQMPNKDCMFGLFCKNESLGYKEEKTMKTACNVNPDSPECYRAQQEFYRKVIENDKSLKWAKEACEYDRKRGKKCNSVIIYMDDNGDISGYDTSDKKKN